MTDEVADLRRALAESERRRRDVEELLERERAERRAANADADAKAAILGLLGRELRAPLNGALSWSRFVRRELLSHAGREHALGISERNLHGMAHLIDDLLVIAEIGPLRAPRIDKVALTDVFAGIGRERLDVALAPGSALRGDTVRIGRLVERFVASALACAQGKVSVIATSDGGLTLVATFAALPTCPLAIAASWDALAVAVDNGPASELGFFITQKLAEAQGGALSLGHDEGIATLTLNLPLTPRPQERERLLVEVRSALQVLTLGLELLRTRVRDSQDEVPRAWLSERLEQLALAVEQLANVAGVKVESLSASAQPRPASEPTEAR